MPTRMFNEAERKELREKMIQAGFQLIKECGMTHTSVRKVTDAAGLGASTFYNFFPSKEVFVLEMIQYQRDSQLQYFNEVLAGRDKMTIEEGKEFAKRIIFNQNNILYYLTPEDEDKLYAACGNPGLFLDGGSHQDIVPMLLSHVDGVRKDTNPKVIANLVKMMAFALFHRKEMHEDVLDETFDHIYEQIFSLLFEEKS